MITITTTRHPVKFYFGIVMGFLAFTAMGLASGYSFLDKYFSGTLLPKNYPMLVVCPGCIFLAFFTVYRYYRNTPVITADKIHIRFNGETLLWTDLVKIELTGKRPFRYLFNVPLEGAALHFNDGRTRYVFDDLYANSWQLKSFLQQVIIDKKETAEILTQKVDPVAVKSENFVRFKDNQFTSLRGISLWGMLLFILFLLVSKFETEGRLPNCLRIITKDFRNNRYPAATLRDRTWLLLQEQLEMKGIMVRNECIYGGEKINRKPGNDN